MGTNISYHVTSILLCALCGEKKEYLTTEDTEIHREKARDTVNTVRNDCATLKKKNLTTEDTEGHGEKEHREKRDTDGIYLLLIYPRNGR